jgi:hypothetical protein
MDLSNTFLQVDGPLVHFNLLFGYNSGETYEIVHLCLHIKITMWVHEFRVFSQHNFFCGYNYNTTKALSGTRESHRNFGGNRFRRN